MGSGVEEKQKINTKNNSENSHPTPLSRRNPRLQDYLSRVCLFSVLTKSVLVPTNALAQELAKSSNFVEINHLSQRRISIDVSSRSRCLCSHKCPL